MIWSNKIYLMAITEWMVLFLRDRWCFTYMIVDDSLLFYNKHETKSQSQFSINKSMPKFLLIYTRRDRKNPRKLEEDRVTFIFHFLDKMNSRVNCLYLYSTNSQQHLHFYQCQNLLRIWKYSSTKAFQNSYLEGIPSTRENAHHWYVGSRFCLKMNCIELI